MCPQLNKSGAAGLPGTGNIEYVNALHHLFNCQCITANEFRLPADIDPTKFVLSINTLVMCDFRPTQRTTTIIEDDWLDGAIHRSGITGCYWRHSASLPE
jgi:hypothetical protein